MFLDSNVTQGLQSLTIPLGKMLRGYSPKVYQKLFGIADKFKPFIRTTKYRGFITYFSRGTSLIERIKYNQTYEEDLCKAIILELNRNASAFFLDIGANIGLITLNILAEIPDIHIFAFEPGPHQSSLFEKTIEKNNLRNRVNLYRFALGQKCGVASFAVHNTQDASGDGFLDTGRAGKVQFITVPVRTIDYWWKATGFPKVGAIKIDTEGSELWVLNGAEEFLKDCRPIVFLEIHPTNLRPYPYDHRDIVKWLNSHDYELFTTDDKPCVIENVDECLKKYEMFIARPRL